MNLKSKKGTYIMEAAIVFPLVVMTMLTVVFIVGFFYQRTYVSSEMHIALRSSAGMLTEMTVYGNQSRWHGDISTDKSTLGGKVSGKEYLRMINKGLINGKGTALVEGHYYATNGPKYVRYCNLAKDLVRNED